ncbi:probable ATP-dependent DNA helicase HFM1 isoform X4 [Parasteatoda tepidariorum]|uniref:probable ATP-dependent DNA helicase HFM1 isoform X4 n=1 Tax=Parasteatoda tepidariorum TaxID=114398 RepID=UPI001C723650|nr:probable ATP-dependent DNA helicase HFM1 isoform X3 [Parasteatoda tepidariorum]
MYDVDTFDSLFGDVFMQNTNSKNIASSNKPNADENVLKNETNSKHLVPVSEIPSKYQSIFKAFPNFNIVQSAVFEDVFYTDKSLAVCAPTGSGKTVIFELGIIRLLMLISDIGQISSRYKIIYMAPVKSLCNERYEDWNAKFSPLGALCIQLTGDTDLENYFELQKYSIILTTPEKWDSVTRVWKNNRNLVQTVKLLLIDEVHLLNEEERGATLEAALSRMKAIQTLLMRESSEKAKAEPNLRFIAVSATLPNAEDVCEWLSLPNRKGEYYNFHEDLRPVQLKKVVVGYPCSDTQSEFRFDLMLSYKLNNVIQTYSEAKPTLVFCATRKSVVQTALILSKATSFVFSSLHKQKLIEAAGNINDTKLRDCILKGIGFHHAGLSVSDRRIIEEFFLMCQIQVIISTSTLSMGVNFPAHLVIIKSTNQYAGGCYKEYSDTQILQMIGRAGRPQEKYESIVSGKQLVESNLHKHIVEHLNAEIVLGTITDVSIAMEWLRATYLYQRVFKNPKYYGMNMELSKEKIEKKLLDMCLIELNGLRKYKLIFMDNDSFNVEPTDAGRLMARYYLSFETMKLFCSLSGKENLPDLLNLISASKEFEDVQLRVSEKKLLNDLNKSKTLAIRFPLQGKIKTRAMKVDCLIQASFGCLPISEPIFNQDIAKIFRSGARISQCLSEYLEIEKKSFSVLYNAIILAKCFRARLWENSKHVSRQVDKIGVTLSTLLVNAGLTSFERILRTNPREIELILNRHPPFGNHVIDNIKQLPQYEIQAEQTSVENYDWVNITVSVFLKNSADMREKKASDYLTCHLLIRDALQNVLLCKKIRNSQLIELYQWCKKISRAQNGDEINIHLISDSYVGLDVNKSFKLEYHSSYSNEPQRQTKESGKTKIESLQNQKRICTHKCLNKMMCGHTCCKNGVTTSTRKTRVENFLDEMHHKINSFPTKKIKVGPIVKDGGKLKSALEQTQKVYVETVRSSKSTLGDERTGTPCVDEMWGDERNMQDFWINVSNSTDSANKEKDLSDGLYFNLNFEDNANIECGNDARKKETNNPSPNQANKISENTKRNRVVENRDSPSTSVPYEEFIKTRKIMTVEQQKDPAAQKELYDMIVGYLSNY